MGMNLTEGTTALILNREVTGEKDLLPVLQVVELKELKITNYPLQQQQQEPRFRLLLSDGSLMVQGMLSSSKNELVISSKLKAGSIVQLTQYICNTILDRMIVIVIDLNVIIEKQDIIGNPVNTLGRPTRVPIDHQPSTMMAQTNSFRGRSIGVILAADMSNSAAGTALQQSRMNPSHGSNYFLNESMPAANSPPVYPKSEPSGRSPGSSSPSTSSASYGAQITGFSNPRPPASGTSLRQPISAYQCILITIISIIIYHFLVSI